MLAHSAMMCALLQGIGRLTLSFQQLAVAAMSIGAIHTLQAASVHPPITRLASGLFFLVGGGPPPCTSGLAPWFQAPVPVPAPAQACARSLWHGWCAATAATWTTANCRP